MKNKKFKFDSVLFTYILLCLSILFQSCTSNQEPKHEANSIIEPEITTTELAINKTIQEAYKIWYVKKGKQPDFSNYDNYYTKTAVFQSYENDSLVLYPIKSGVQNFKDAFVKGHLSSFDEREIGAKTIHFGNVAHRISYHTYRTNSNDSITSRGVNSIQLVRINGKWKVQSILRQIESESYRLPTVYDNSK